MNCNDQSFHQLECLAIFLHFIDLNYKFYIIENVFDSLKFYVELKAGRHETRKWLIVLLLIQSVFLVAVFAYLK